MPEWPASMSLVEVYVYILACFLHPDRGFHPDNEGSSKEWPDLRPELHVEKSREDEDAQKFSYRFRYSNCFLLAQGACTQPSVSESLGLCNK